MKFDCEVIRDLLPNFADGLTCEKTNIIVNDHINHCPSCKKILEDFKKPIESGTIESEEIDFLKKYRTDTKKKLLINRVVLFSLFAVICLELIIHLLPFEGATKSDLKYLSEYPITEIALDELKTSKIKDTDKTAYFYDWHGGNFMQNAKLIFELEESDDLSKLSSDEVIVDCNSLFFKQTGSSINTVENVVYIKVSGYRKTLFAKGKGEQFGFAVKIEEEGDVVPYKD